MPESSPIVALMLTAITVDYVTLIGDALYEGMSSVYFEIGGSQGTLWWDPILAGTYAEEGLYDGPYDQPNLGFPMLIIQSGAILSIPMLGTIILQFGIP